MRKILFISAFLLTSSVLFAQQNNKAKDTIKTEVINVVTSYTPTISDAFKIKKNPTIQLGVRTQKKQLQYQIFSAPVASTFTPKSGTAKAPAAKDKEPLFKNYIAMGFGNYTTPFFEAFIQHSTNPNNNFGLYANVISAKNTVENSLLKSGYSSLNAGAFYSQHYKGTDMNIEVDLKNDIYNWYGLPTTIPYTAAAINSIKETQSYTGFNLRGKLTFEDSYIDVAKTSLSFFSDDYSSKELRFGFRPIFNIPLKRFGAQLNELNIRTSIDYLSGAFEQTYAAATKTEYGFFTLGLAPTYTIKSNRLTVKLGATMYLASDLENRNNQFFIYPDIQITYPFSTDYFNFFAGISGDLKTNSYESLVAENPFLSPTQTITQTNEMYQFFGGFYGKLTSNIHYNIKASYKNEEDKPLFVRNNSKSNGTNTAGLQGYEYGNSFSVLYDDVKTFTLFGELTLDVLPNLQVGGSGTLHSFSLTNQATAWNLPKLKGELFASYKLDKWYAGARAFYVHNQYDLLYSGTYPSAINGTQKLKSYFDLNVNGGYHINKKLTAFLKANNLFNSDYQRYANFRVQGFQILGGLSYQFDF